MKSALPPAVKRYLGELPDDTRKMAYVRLDADRCVDLSGGHLKQCEVGSLDASIPIDQQIDSLVGLLPTGHLPLIIENARKGQSRYLDLHLFIDNGQQWIVLFDNTDAAVKLQATQQKRLTGDMIKEKKH